MNRNLACRSLALAGLLALSFSPAVYALESVADLRWCPGTRDCLLWSPSDGAVHYSLYRGTGEQLPAVLDAAIDSCTVGSYTETTTGTFPEDAPAAGDLRWYLVATSDGEGAESAGHATSGPRSIDSAGTCFPSATAVLNEVDYDQAGTDNAEFVEIYNPGPAALDLAGIVLILVNGDTQAEYTRVRLSDATPVLAAGGYLVVGAAAIQASLPDGTPFVAFGLATNNMQNGAPDGVALFDVSSGTLIDALSYEGSIEAAQFDGVTGTFSLVEGTPTPLADSNSITGTLGRFPDGQDTGDAASDWFFISVPSPGASNPVP